MVADTAVHFVFVGLLALTASRAWAGGRLSPEVLPLALAAAAIEPALVTPWTVGALAALAVADFAARSDEYATAIFAIAILWITSGVVFGPAEVDGYDADLQAMIVIAGSLIAASPLPRTVLRFFATRWPLAATAGLVVGALPVVPGLGAGADNPLRISVFGFGLQPGEFALVLGIAAVAGLMAGGRASAVRSRYGLPLVGIRVPAVVDIVPIAIVWFGVLVIVRITGDLGTAAILWAAVTAAAAGAIGTWWAAVVVPVGIVSSILVSPMLSASAAQRWQMWLAPWAQDPQANSSHLARALSVAIDGGVFGSGAWAAGLGGVPKVARDAAFTAVLATVGLVGGIAVVVAILAWVRSWWRLTQSAPDEMTAGIRSGVLAYLGCLATLSVLGPIGILPWTGVPVPIVARAGSVALILIGLTGELNGDGKLQATPGWIKTARGHGNWFDRAPAAMAVLVVVAIAAHAAVGSPGVFDVERDRRLVRNMAQAELLDRNGQPALFDVREDIPAVTASAQGERVSLLGVAHLKPGEPTMLTVDSALHQGFATSFDYTGLPYAAIAVDPTSGDILATTSSHGLDPLSVELAPGSTHKLVVATAMIEDDNIDADEWVAQYEGGLVIDEVTLSGGCGGTVASALARSCNAPFAAYAAAFPDRVADYAQRFGFTPARNLGDRSPLVTDDDGDGLPANASVGVHPVGSELTEFQRALVGIGQHDVLATPLGVALVGAAIANDGVIAQPGLLPGGRDDTRVMAGDTAEALAAALAQTVQSGTASHISAPTGIELLGGKTGTAETKTGAGTESGSGESRAWCVLSVGG